MALYATLTGYHPEKKGTQPFQVKLGEGSTVKDLIDLLSLPQDETSQVFIEGRHAARDAVLSEGQRIAIFPPLGGG